MNSETIKVKVLFFGAAADLTGKRNDEVTFPGETTARKARENILKAYPLLNSKYKSSLLFSLNRIYANGDEILNDGDELAFFPPVSGG